MSDDQRDDTPEPEDGDEPSGGTLSPSEELEAALAEASEAVESRGRRPGPAPRGASSAGETLLEALSAELQATKAAYESAQEEVEKLRDQNLRLQAEFDNFRRRGLKEKQETQLYGHQNLVKELLPTVDNLDRAIEHVDRNASEELRGLLQGVELVRKELMGVLERFGVAEVEAEGRPFDPSVHEAMAQTPAADVAPNTVVSVMEKGYLLRDRLLRPARVVVSKATEPAQTESDEG
mgnify:CR=1 FL=1